jgi:hypothetical protein
VDITRPPVTCHSRSAATLLLDDSVMAVTEETVLPSEVVVQAPPRSKTGERELQTEGREGPSSTRTFDLTAKRL